MVTVDLNIVEFERVLAALYCERRKHLADAEHWRKVGREDREAVARDIAAADTAVATRLRDVHAEQT